MYRVLTLEIIQIHVQFSWNKNINCTLWCKKYPNNQHWVFRDDYLIFIRSRAITKNIWKQLNISKIIQSLYICKPQFMINLIFFQLHRQISNMAVITSLTRPVKSSAVYTLREVSLTSRTPYKCIPLCWGFETIPKFRIFMFISFARIFLISGSGFFKLRPRLGMLPLICHMLLDHQCL